MKADLPFEQMDHFASIIELDMGNRINEARREMELRAQAAELLLPGPIRRKPGKTGPA